MQIKSQYSFLKKIQMGLWLVRTKIVCRKARIIRFPIDLRGKKQIDFGVNLTTGVGCRLEAYSSTEKKVLRFGRNVQINDYVHISAMEYVSIGDNVLIAGKIYISDNSHGYYKGDTGDTSPDIAPIERPYRIAPVIIERNVWIGENAVILPGVTIGEGAIIGANSVVSRSIPRHSIAIGSPARVIKQYNPISGQWEKVK